MNYASMVALASMALVASSDAKQQSRLFNWSDLKSILVSKGTINDSRLKEALALPTTTPVTQDLCNGDRRDLAYVPPYFSFTSEFYVIMGGPTAVFQGEEITSVQDVMRDSYNGQGSCQNGLILDAVTISDQELVGANGRDRRLATSFSLVNRYSVKGRCRFCKNDVKLFNDALRRRLGVALDTFNKAALTNLQSAGFDEITSVDAASGSPPTSAPTTQPTPSPTTEPTPLPTPQPTSQPTPQPTALPTSQPTPVPTDSPTTMYPSFICDDSQETQFEVSVVNNVFGTTVKQMQKCIWLAARKIEQVTYCDPDHPQRAYYICPETCRACYDDCTEDPQAMFAYQDGERTCSWLSIRFDIQDKECLPGRSAYSICKETCNSCKDGAGGSLPIAAHELCDDSRDALIFIDDVNGMQSCAWLKNRQDFRDVLCVPNHSSGAYTTCKETCGKCTDTCEDTGGTFVDDNNEQRNCQWLSLQKDNIPSLCVPRNPAFRICPETCGACD